MLKYDEVALRVEIDNKVISPNGTLPLTELCILTHLLSYSFI